MLVCEAKRSAGEAAVLLRILQDFSIFFLPVAPCLIAFVNDDVIGGCDEGCISGEALRCAKMNGRIVFAFSNIETAWAISGVMVAGAARLDYAAQFS